MGKQKLRGKDLRKIGFISDERKSLAINIMSLHFKYLKKAEKLEILEDLKINPEKYMEDEFLKTLAETYLQVVVKKDFTSYKLNEKAKSFKIYGKKFIDLKAIDQMDVAMQVPIAEKGALMPDAHVGYGLPIGGVLATKNEIIPYAIGMDIGCRMALTILDLPESELNKNAFKFKTALKEETHFGLLKRRNQLVEHEVLDRKEFDECEVLKSLKDKACNQIGTSGSGNHFVEFGIVELPENNQMQVPAGNYVGILSHSGSRGFGASIANFYTNVAKDKCRLPSGAKHLAWLDLNSEAGQKYWISMNLAGDYAKACHDVIHQKLKKAIGAKALCTIENHHNFAWKERQENGEELIVHRKGATPAQKGVLGIIPGSMCSPAFIVSGKGNSESLFSASHGAGRKYSRTKMKSSFTNSDLKKILKEKKVTLIGGDIDEAPMAYKNIETVMSNQTELVNVEGTFNPKIVRMCKK